MATTPPKIRTKLRHTSPRISSIATGIHRQATGITVYHQKEKAKKAKADSERRSTYKTLPNQQTKAQHQPRKRHKKKNSPKEFLFFSRVHNRQHQMFAPSSVSRIYQMSYLHPKTDRQKPPRSTLRRAKPEDNRSELTEH